MARGHWPRGRRRSSANPRQVADVMKQLAVLLKTRRKYGVVSARAAAAHVGVSETSVRRWLQGEDFPTPRTLARLAAWIRRHAGENGPN